MSRLIITVNGKQYDVEVEVIEDSIIDDNFASAAAPSQNIKPKSSSSATSKPKAAKKAVTSSSSTQTSTDGLNSPINGVVLDIPVKAGSSVKEGDIVIVLEAMKMKTNIFAPFDTTISEILVNIGDNIESGQKLVKFA